MSKGASGQVGPKENKRREAGNYEQQSVADFNQSLAPDNGDISGLLDAQAEVLASISPDDENYEFITMTLAASLDELYCEQMVSTCLRLAQRWYSSNSSSALRQ